jgi:hypothetical protein
MANTGFNSTGKSSSGITGAVGLTRATIDNGYNTAIGHGDPVHVHTDGYLILTPETVQATHILRGIEYIDANGEWRMLDNFPAGTTNSGTVAGFTDVVAIIEPVADRLFRIDTDDAALAQTHIGQQFRVKNAGTVTLGRSQAVVDLDASVTSENRLVEIVAIDETQGNDFGDDPATVLVKFV